TDELRAEGWDVLPVSLQKLWMDRIRATGDDSIQALINREKRLYAKDPQRALSHLREKIAPHIEGPNGIAADVAKLINDFADAASIAGTPRTPGKNLDRTLVLIGRAGSLYPFFRSS